MAPTPPKAAAAARPAHDTTPFGRPRQAVPEHLHPDRVRCCVVRLSRMTLVHFTTFIFHHPPGRWASGQIQQHTTHALLNSTTTWTSPWHRQRTSQPLPATPIPVGSVVALPRSPQTYHAAQHTWKASKYLLQTFAVTCGLRRQLVFLNTHWLDSLEFNPESRPYLHR